MLSPCPKGRLANVEPDHCDIGGRYPLLSPGSSMPVFTPTPNLFSYASHVSGPSFCATLSVPTLDDSARMPVAVKRSVGWYHASATVASPMVIVSGTLITLFGLISPSCTAAAKVIDFCTDPGSNADMTGAFIGLFVSIVFGSLE